MLGPRWGCAAGVAQQELPRTLGLRGAEEALGRGGLDDAAGSMNTTRVAASRAKAISWVTTTMVMPSAARSRITTSTSPTSSGSSALVGSSNSSSSGRITARGRCRPAASGRPTAAPGMHSRLSSSPTLRSSASASSRHLGPRPPLHVQRRLHHVLQHGQMRPQREMLEHHADARPHARQLGVAHRHVAARPDADPRAGQLDAARVGPLQPVDAAQQGRLCRSPTAPARRRSRPAPTSK